MLWPVRSFRGGISDEASRGIAGSFQFGYGLDIHKRRDSLSAKQAMATVLDASTGVLGGAHVGTTLTAPFLWFVPASDGTTYCFGATGSIFSFSGDGRWTFVHNDENGRIGGAAEFELSDGADYLWWATATAISRKALNGVDITPDSGTARWTDATIAYKTENVFSNEWHPMAVTSGALHTGNRQALAQVDFDGDFDPGVLNIRPGNKIKAIEERDDYTILGSYREDETEQGHIWSWLITAQNWVQKKLKPVKGVNALITTEQNLLQGGNAGEIFPADFANSIPLAEIEGGGEVFPGGVTIEDDLALFGFFGGTYPGIWSYGRRNKNRSNALNYEYRLAKTVGGSTISTIGAIMNINGIVYASWGTTDESTSEYGVDAVSSTTKVTAVYRSLEFDGQIPHAVKKFNAVKLTMTPLPTGCGVSLCYRKERNDTETFSEGFDAGDGFIYATVGGGTDTTFSAVGETEVMFQIGDTANLFELEIELTPFSNETAEINSVTTYINDESYEYA